MPITYRKLLKQYKSVMYIKEEPDLVPLVYGTILANRLDTKPVWLTIIAGPSSGKTLIIDPLSKAYECYPVSNLTEKSLISHAKNKDTVDGKDASLLAKLDGKVMIVKDASTITEMNPHGRSALFSQLRNAFDGEHESDSGLGRKSFKAKFGIIIAGTPALDKLRSMEQNLGERFLSFRPVHENFDKVADFIHLCPPSTEKYKALDATAYEYLNTCGTPGAIEYPIEIKKHAELLVVLRSPVSRDFHQRIDHPVDDGIESPTRAFHQLAALFTGIKYVTGSHNRALSIVKRVAIDSIPHSRLRYLKCLKSGLSSQVEIAKSMKVHKTTVARISEELEMLDVVSIKLSTKSKFNALNPEYRRLFNLCVRD